MLYEQIIEAGYDATAFQVYCETIKENGSQDIDLWTVPEMTKLISDFRRKEEYLINIKTVSKWRE